MAKARRLGVPFGALKGERGGRRKAGCLRASQNLQGPLSAQPDFGPDFGPIFWSYPAHFSLQQRAYKLATVSHTLASKVETLAARERKRIAHARQSSLPLGFFGLGRRWTPSVTTSEK